MPSPPFSVVRAVEHLVDDAPVGFVRPVLHECLNLPLRGRQSVHVQVDAAHERNTVGGGGGLDTVFIQLSQNERIDAVLDPTVLDGWRLVVG